MTARRRRWRKWLVWLLALLVIGRLLLAVFLLPLLNLAAGSTGLAITWRSASLSLLGISLHAADVVVRLVEDPEPPLLEVQDLVVDASMWQLLHGRLGIVDAALDSAHVRLQRRADGSLRLPASTAAATAVAKAPAATTTPAPFSFDLPFGIASIRVHDLQLDYEDLTATPPSQLTATLDLDASDLGRPDREASLRVRLHAAELLDEAEVAAQWHAAGDHFDATWQAAVRGVRTNEPHLPAALREPLRDFRLLAIELHGSLGGQVLPAMRSTPLFGGDVTATVSLDGREHVSVTATAGPTTTTDGALDLPFAMTLQGVDLVESLRLESGRLHLGREETTASAVLTMQGLTAQRLRPMLARIGVALPAPGIDLRAELNAELGAATSLRLANVVLDADGTTTALPRVELRDLRLDGETLAIRSIEIEGPELAVHRAIDGAIVCAGVRLTPPPLLTPADATPTSPPAMLTLPQLRIGHIGWHGASFAFVDETLTPPATAQLEQLEVVIDALTIGAESPPAHLLVTASMPGALRSLRFEGMLTPRRTALAIDLHTALDGLTATRLQPWLATAGITPVLRDGTLQLTAAASVECVDGGMRGELMLSNVRLSDGDDVYLRLRNVAGHRLRWSPHELALGDWTVDDPFAAVHRTADLQWEVGGMRFGPAPASTASPAAPSAPVATTSEAAVTPSGSLVIRGGGVQFTDGGDATPRLLGFDAQAALGNAETPSTFDATLRLEGIVETCRLRGDYLPTREPQLEVALDIAGVHGAELAHFLPPGMTCDLEQGALNAHLSLTTDPSLSLRVQGLALTDRGAELAAVDAADLQLAPTQADHLHVTNLTVAGVRALLTRTETGLHVAGFVIATAPPPNQQPAATDPAPPTTPLAQPAPLRLPILAIDTLSITVDSVVVRERLATDGEPLRLAGQLTLLAPWQPKADGEHPLPAQLQWTGTAAPICASLHADLTVDPYEVMPSLDATAKVTGIDTTAVARVFPSLASRVQGRVTAAELTGHLHAQLDFKRRDARTFDFTKPLAGEVTIEDLTLRDTTTDTVIAGVESIDAVVRALDITTGDVLLRSLDIDAPNLVVTKTAAGIEVFGFCLADQPTGATTAAPLPSPATAATGAEFAIDRLDLQGLTFDYTDSTTTPSTRLPVSPLDLQLLHFSTRAFSEPWPVQFHVDLQGAPIPLERRVVASSVLAGILGSAARAVTGQSDRHEVESRPWLDSLQASGDLQLSPYRKGDITVNLVGLELPAFRGLAKTGGVEIADGLFDLSLALGLRGLDGVDIDSQSVFTWLSITEPPNGPISTYLRLPAALDSVLFLLKNDAEEQRVPFHMRVGGPGDGTSVTDHVVEALALKIANSVASAGSRMVGTLTGAVGLGGSAQLPIAHQDFAAGDPRPNAGDLDAVVQALANDATLRVALSHELGAEDLERTAVLASPKAPIVRETVDRLRAERHRLQMQRGLLADEVAARYATGQIPEARPAQARLADLDQSLGKLERTLEEALTMVGGDTARAARRRTRTAATELANARLRAIREELLRRVPSLTADRIELRRPRAAVTQGLDAGGRVLAVTRRSNE